MILFELAHMYFRTQIDMSESSNLGIEYIIIVNDELLLLGIKFSL